MVPHRPTPGNDPLLHSMALSCGAASAQCSPPIADALRQVLADDVEAWPRHGLTSIKERTVRSVFTGVLGGVPVHLKLFRADTFADRIRDLVRRDRGAAEAAHLAHTRSLGLPAVEPLAFGFARHGKTRCSFVVTRTVAGTPFTFAATSPVQHAVGRLLRSLHDLGIRHDDLHPGNVLVGADGSPWLLDLTSVRHGGVPSLRERASGLARFCQELDGGPRDRQAAHVLGGYLAAGPLPPTFADELRAATLRWRADALPSFGRRAGRPCRHTEVSARRRGQPRWCWHQPEADAATRDAVAAFAAASPAPDKTGRRGSVWLLPELVVKERPTAEARRIWRASYWLLFAGVAAAPPVALRTFAGRGHVVARRLAAPSLAAELAAGALDARALVAAAHDLGHQVGRLHAHGLGNRDLKFDNLVRDPHTGHVCMVDLDGVRRRAVIDTRGRGADLGRLLAAFRGAGAPGGATTLRTFLRSYLRAWRDLLQRPPLRRLLARAEQRAGEWASAHR